MRKVFFFLLCLTASVLARAQSYTFRYWFDEVARVTTLSGSAEQQLRIDMNGVADGLHTLHFQVIDSRGVASATQTKYVVKQASASTGKLRYWFDGQTDNGGELNAAGGISSIDTSTLPDGIHSLHVQVRSEIPSAVQNAFFVKMPSSNSLKNLTCVTMIDGKVAKKEHVSNGDVPFTIMLNTDTIPAGIHTITVELQTSAGMPSAIHSAWFEKQPTDNRILSYEYWVNGDFEQHKKVVVEADSSEYCLQAMLPVPQYPFSSKSFDFENNGNVPMVYAKNELSVRFFDKGARSMERSVGYGDATMGQKVENIDTLISNRSVTKEKPGENEIQWYRFAATPTDSIRIQVGRACTVQVFAPSGEEVLNQTGSTSWETFNAKERGDYYLALHDVTSGNNTTLRFISQRRALRTGDVNGDGDVDVTDMNLIIDVICGVRCSYDCDINGDGTVDVTDLNLVIDVICGA